MPRHKPFVDRFWDKIEKTERCWLWRGKRSESGYGLVYCAGGRFRAAHRIAFEIHSGEHVPENLEVCHACDNPACVNPDHLFLGSHSDNMKDMVVKGRSFSQRNRELAAARIAKVRICPPTGQSHHWARLTDEKVVEIRRLRESGMKYDDIAAIVGVGKSTIGRIINRDVRGGWSHID